MSSEVEFTKDGPVARVTLNRPKSLNAITPAMDDALFAAWNDINDDPDIRVAILSATGEKAFCAGGDVSGGTENPDRRMALGGGLTGVGGPLLTLRKPLIAAVQGYVIGGGCELAMCADIVVAADTTQFGIPETKVGIIGEAGIMHRAIRQLPHHVALAMILTGERLPAAKAELYGLVNEVVPYADLSAAAERWARKVAAGSPLAVQAAKDAALSRLGWPLDVALATRYEPIEAYASSKDRLEGRAAFAEKRPPQWQGR
ncbi:enoyl-CoA hydratase-related protein [Streptomyces sp. NPDC058001]|uniref:enoyl-CoA hydratase-related protein n=1 Tax=Streptomyces sp. NPDC058001 TaxID=3346300 RepID=UPI0036E51316